MSRFLSRRKSSKNKEEQETHDHISGVHRLTRKFSSVRSKNSGKGDENTEHDNDHRKQGELVDKLPQMHISLRLSSLKNGSSLDHKSAPQTPDSTSSFDFNLNRSIHAVTNSSLNVALDEGYDYDRITKARVSLDIKRDDEQHLQEDKGDQEPKVPREKHEVQNSVKEEGDGLAIRRIKETKSHYTIVKRGVKDFEFGKTLGEGSYSTVQLATDKHTSKMYAIKILDKRHIIKEKKVKYVNVEKNALNRLSNRDGIISLYFTFQDKLSLFFVLDYASKGELLNLIRQYNSLSEECVRYFGAQILDAIKFMHEKGIVHRDIKPENILLDDNYRIQITDFGTARLIEKENEDDENYPVDVRANSFVGTAEYVSPELLESKYCGKPGDIWAFGCLIYQMIAGKPPFKAVNEYLTFQKIMKLQYAFSAGFPMVLRDLIKKILVLQPEKRYTIQQIQRHFFFESVDWTNHNLIWNCEVPEFKPYKMNAKSMTRGVGMTPSSPAAFKNNKKVVEPSSSLRKVSGDGSGQKTVSAANAAAYVLNKGVDSLGSVEGGSEVYPKDTGSNSFGRSNGQEGSAPRPSLAPDYIPGTKILRPSIPSRTKVPRHHSQQNKVTTKKSQPDLFLLKPPTDLDIEWAPFMKSEDERILKIGPAVVHTVLTDTFLRKNRGLIHDTPLGLRFQNISASGGTFLSQVVQGNSKGFRDTEAKIGKDDETYDESDAVVTYFETVEVPQDRLKDFNASVRPSLFKYILARMDNNGNPNTNNENTEELSSKATPQLVHQNPLVNPRSCLLMVTNQGRALILYKKEGENKFSVASRIQLSSPIVLFKELIPSGKRTGWSGLSGTSMLAIQSSITTFMCEVDHFEFKDWSESLATSKIMQTEREQLSSNSLRKTATSSSNKSSPRVPDFSSSPSPNVNVASGERSSVTDTEAAKKLKGPPKRKPPPKSPYTATAFPQAEHENLDDATLLAAKLAVSHSTPPSNKVQGRSSFTKNRAKDAQQNDLSTNASSVVNTNNSKLLARSQRKK